MDSAAAIALLSELVSAGIGADAEVEVDGALTRAKDAQALGSVRSVTAVATPATVQVLRTVVEDWDRLRGLAMSAGLRDAAGPTRTLTLGDAVELIIRIEDPGGYKAGDLAWVCLPPALTRVVGGAQVRRFSVDFRGRTELAIPLVATAISGSAEPRAQRYAVCVRNMFEEERVGNPGLLEVTVRGRAGLGSRW